MAARRSDDPVRVTTAALSRAEELRGRQRRYLISMGIRTVCFVLAIVTTGPLRWILVAAAVFLPYVAVVLANATDRRRSPGPASFVNDEVPTIEAKPVDDEPRRGDS